MQWFGPANSLEFIDKPDALTIRATSIRRLGDLIWPAGCLIAALATFYFGSPIVWPIILGGVTASLFAQWLDRSIVELQVSRRDLSTQSFRSWKSSTIKLRWFDVQALEYRGGGKNQSRGLYAKESFLRSWCLIPRLNREESQRAIEAIGHKFPDIVLANGAEFPR